MENRRGPSGEGSGPPEGIEGDAARIYFEVFNELIAAQKTDFSFGDRNRRPPLDRVNALLSFIYTILYNDLRSAQETPGLDPAVGFLHQDRPGRMSLALDLIEEFRPFIAERLVLSVINLKQVDQKDLSVSESGAVLFFRCGEEDRRVRFSEAEAGLDRSSLCRGGDARGHPSANPGSHARPPYQG